MSAFPTGQSDEVRQQWFIDESKIVGKKIVEVKYMGEDEAEEIDWQRCPILVLEDGTEICPLRDDEGNGSGVLSVFLPDDEDQKMLPHF